MSKIKALIIDDEKDIRELIEMAFVGMKIECVLAATVKEALAKLKKEKLDFCITDMKLPDGSGMDLLRYIQNNLPELPVCVITAHGNVDIAVEALKLGAFDFVNKPFDLKQLRAMADAAVKLNDRTKSTAKIDTKTGTANKSSPTKTKIIGLSRVMQKLEAIIKKLARSQAPVFIHGESGTGKELVARSIYEHSARFDGPFIAVNCGAIPESLVESEFFGYKKGAFTGANKDQKGLFESANGGVLFLDEVADLPLSMQVKLLRAIQERAVRPVGGDTEIPVDIRILSATHKDLAKLVEEKEFRQDLYYRLNVISLKMPPLRKRAGDVLLITKYILTKLAKSHNLKNLKITKPALIKLSSYDFPGNVRELENILERAVTFCEGEKIEAENIFFSNSAINNDDDDDMGMNFDLDSDSDNDLSDNLPENNNLTGKSEFDLSETAKQKENPTKTEKITPIETVETVETTEVETPKDIGNLDEYLEKVEKEAIKSALEKSGGNKTKAAKQLGISFRSFRYKVDKYKI